MKLSWNIFSNLVGAAISAYGGVEIASGTMTPEKFGTLGPLAMVSFLADRQNDKIRRLGEQLTPEQKQAAKGVGSILLNQALGPLGFKVVTTDNPGNAGLGAPPEQVNSPVGRDRPSATWVSAPESIAPNSDRARAQAAYAADVARGRAASPDQMNQMLQGSDDEPQSGVFKGQGEWLN